MINDMAQLWRLPPSFTLEGTIASLEEAQILFMKVFPLSLIIVAPSYVNFVLNFWPLDFRVQLNVCLPCALSPLNMCLKRSYIFSVNVQDMTKRN